MLAALGSEKIFSYCVQHSELKKCDIFRFRGVVGRRPTVKPCGRRRSKEKKRKKQTKQKEEEKTEEQRETKIHGSVFGFPSEKYSRELVFDPRYLNCAKGQRGEQGGKRFALDRLRPGMWGPDSYQSY